MKHADASALDQLEPLLSKLRKCAGLKEKQRGVFYRKSKAFLHFHEDPAGLFADLRAGAGWERLPAGTRAEQAIVLARVKAAMRT